MSLTDLIEAKRFRLTVPGLSSREGMAVVSKYLATRNSDEYRNFQPDTLEFLSATQLEEGAFVMLFRVREADDIQEAPSGVIQLRHHSRTPFNDLPDGTWEEVLDPQS